MAQMKKQRILAISWSLPPLLGPRSIQVGRTMKQLAANGWACTLVSVDTRSLPKQLAKDDFLAKHYIQNYEVVRVPAPTTFQLLAVVRRFMPKLAPMPDNQSVWVKSVLSKVQTILEQESYDVLLSFGHPWSDHLIGLEIKRRWKMPWVAHFSDPWSDNPYYFHLSAHQKKKMRALEYSVIKAADAAIFTNKETADLVFDKYPSEMGSKAQVIPHGYDRDLLKHIRKSDRQDSRLQLVHTGNLYGLRTPWGILNALSKLKHERRLNYDLEIVFVGRAKGRRKFIRFCEQQGLKHVRFIDTLPYMDSLQVAAGADVLLIIDAPVDSESVFLPSKLMDYMIFDKPILGLTPDRGVVASLLDELGFSHCDPLDETRIAEALVQLGKFDISNTSDHPKRLRSGLDRFDIEHTTAELQKVLGSVISR